MAYQPTIWVNNSQPFLNSQNLNKQEQGIEDAHDIGEAAQSDADTASQAVADEATARQSADSTLAGGIDSEAQARVAHEGETTGAHGGIVASTDSRLTNQRTPTDGSVANAKVPSGAGIAESKLALASDAPANVASRRTLGTGGSQAAAGNHNHGTTSNFETSQRIVYVSPTGSDTTGDGSSTLPWRTIQFAVNQAKPNMQIVNGTSAYKVVCKTGTYNETVSIPANSFASFDALGRGGTWIASETGIAADVVISAVGAFGVEVFGSCSLDALTIESDDTAVKVRGSSSALAFLYKCTLRRKSLSDGGGSAVQAQIGTAIVREVSSVAGRLFQIGLNASVGGTIAKAQTPHPSGSTANETVATGGVIR